VVEAMMVRAVVVKGHLVGPSSVELEEPVVVAEGRDVEVIVRVPEPTHGAEDSLATFLRSLPPGTRSKADIDQQLRDERDSWS
jgi:hypothetical protein